MNGASNFVESLGDPTDHVLAILDDRAQANKVLEALHAAGYATEEIGLLRGESDASKLDAPTGEKGLFGKLLSIGPEMGDRDSTYLEQYRAALLRGAQVIGVVAKDEQTQEEIHQILKAQGGHYITAFGKFVTKGLES